MSDDTASGATPPRDRPADDAESPADRRRTDTSEPTGSTADGRGSAPGGERSGSDTAGDGAVDPNRPRRRRGSRGGRNRSRSAGSRPDESSAGDRTTGDRTTGDRAGGESDASRPTEPADASAGRDDGGRDGAAADAAARRPRIGDTRPAPAPSSSGGRATAADRSVEGADGGGAGSGSSARRRRRRGGRGRSSGGSGSTNGGGGRTSASSPVEAVLGDDDPIELDDATLKRRRGRERKGRPVGRYLMAVSVRPEATQIAVLEGRNLIEHHVSRPSDDDTQIHGNIYLGRVQNVLPGMEAAFIDIGTPKNAVLYRGDVHFDPDDVDSSGGQPRIEDVLKARQSIICQVTKNPIAHKGARLTQEVSLPGRFVVLVPNSSTYGISKRLPDNERKRLRSILDRVKPDTHGIIVRTAAENVTAEEIERDVARLVSQW
ncbi:MAG TPA: ribonuclease E/G, partial [Acidimicrobiales bacterium]|nr:ribonuclease E/G [Acidimicrobiales bacterium]